MATMLEKEIKAGGKALLDIDDAAHRVCQPYADTLPIKLLDVVSKIGDQPELRTVSAAMVAIGTFGGNDRLVRAGARMMIAHEAATVAKGLLKTNVDRTRPRSANGRDEKKPRKGRHKAKELSSFPSGHSAGAIAAARAFSREFPEYGPAAVGAALFIALLQIPRCAHYPTDVAAGLLIGLAAEATVDAGWQAAEMDERSAS